MKCLRMPEHLRGSLGRGFLGVRVCGDEEHVTRSVIELVGSCGGVVAVGDFVCLKLLERGYTPRVCIADRSTRRLPADRIPSESFSTILTCFNPRSHICVDSIEKLVAAIKESEGGGRVLLVVEGEEDLLALASMVSAPTGWCVVYGLPGCGAEVVAIDNDVIATAKNILALFEEVELPR